MFQSYTWKCKEIHFLIDQERFDHVLVDYSSGDTGLAEGTQWWMGKSVLWEELPLPGHHGNHRRDENTALGSTASYRWHTSHVQYLELKLNWKTRMLLKFVCAGFVRARGGGDIRDVNLNSENWAVVKAALVAGMYPNLIHVNRDNLTLMGFKEKKVRFHPTSVLSQPQYKKVSDSRNFFVLCFGK